MGGGLHINNIGLGIDGGDGAGIYTVGYRPGVGVVCINNTVWVDRGGGGSFRLLINHLNQLPAT